MTEEHTNSHVLPGHLGPLCDERHVCPSCETGGECEDLFSHPICGLVACCSDECNFPDCVEPVDPSTNDNGMCAGHRNVKVAASYLNGTEAEET